MTTLHSKKHSSVARRLFLGLALFAMLTAAGCGSSNAQGVTTPNRGSASAPSVVLVHGAWADGSSWAKVIELLQKRGHKVVSVQLPRATLAGDAAAVRRAIESEPDRVILAGHSYGGVVITEAGNSPKVAGLVYVSAFAPGDGESIFDLVKPYPPGEWQKGLVPDSAGYLGMNAETFRAYFAQDLPAKQSAVLAATQGPIFNHVLEDKVTVAAWKSKPSWWAVTGADKIVPAAFQQGQAARIKAKVTVIPGASHAGLLSRPEAIAAVILDALGSISKP
ncbi:alpha/beta hydrolase [Massilia sp. IC2-477]|uniref:alpha/beta fold hydrolase n=1 Tax=Massilia sp. IC2-477 TaxID=2887198 RepID=UPI001D116BEC|nr:alpha/beta hydrolase [Massilia sp. IC2-477]MCC2954356.1 alpha/beta hydrolase [Massilia sp. IC2-477]